MANEARLGESLIKLLGVWDRRKWLAILAFAAAFSMSATVTFELPAIYQSTATVSVEGQQVPPDVARLQGLSQRILSRSRLEELIDLFDLYPTVRTKLSTDELVKRVRSDIEVKPSGVDRAGNLLAFTVTYQGRDASTTAQVANTLASAYVAENTTLREQQASSAAEFLRTQLADVNAKLQQQERNISKFKQQYHSELPAQMESNVQQLERRKTDLRLNGESQARTRNQIESAKRSRLTPTEITTPQPKSAASASASPESVQLKKLKQELDTLKQELDVLQTQYTDRHPDVIQKRAQIQAHERRIADLERKIAANPLKPSPAPVPTDEHAVPVPEADQMEQTVSALKAKLKSLVDDEADIKADIATYQARIDNTPTRDMELQALSRDYDATRDQYRTLLKQHQGARLSESLEQRQQGEQFRVTEKALPPTAASAPNQSRLLVVSLALSIGLAAGLVFLAEQLDTSLHTIDELKAVSTLPVLISIPQIVTEGDIRRRRWRISLAAVAALCALILLVGVTYYLTAGNELLLRILSPGRI